MKKAFRSSTVRSYGTLAAVIRGGNGSPHFDLRTNKWLFIQ
jgi:hypothetical protein